MDTPRAQSDSRDVLRDLRGRVRREQRPVPKEILAGLVELVEGYETAPPEQRAILAKHIENGLALMAIYGDERPHTNGERK